MLGHGRFVLLALLLFNSVWSDRPFKTGATVLCECKKSCVLPCGFRSVRTAQQLQLQLYWIRTEDKTPVFSFSFKYTKLSSKETEHPGNPFKNRVALFHEELSQGNASLLLTDVQMQDQGIYRCLIKNQQRIFKSSLLHVDVQAPVRHVSLVADGQRLKCVSKDIFPKPSVSWSCSCENTSVTPSETGLFSVLSSVPLRPLEEISCKISTEHSWKSATYRENPAVDISNSEVTLRCDSHFSLMSLSRVWKFNEKELIVTQSSEGTVYSKTWRQFVAGVSKSGNLTLKGLRKEHKGLYTCNIITDRQTYSIHTRLRAPLKHRIRQGNGSLDFGGDLDHHLDPDSSGLDPGVVVGIVFFVVVCITVGLTAGFCLWRHKKVESSSQKEKTTKADPPENSQLLGSKAQVSDGKNETLTEASV